MTGAIRVALLIVLGRALYLCTRTPTLGIDGGFTGFLDTSHAEE
jgi:hypothetical protein